MNALPRFRVDSLSLNLRSSPAVRAGTRLAVLPRGHLVTALGSAPDDDWIMVSAEIGGATVTGFVAHRFLTSLDAFEELPPRRGVTEVHLRENHPQVRRNRAGGRAFPIGEAGRPSRRVTGTRQDEVAALTKILDWLDVENSARYQATGSSTFCNIYAHDYCYLAHVYLPRVWWGGRAVARLEAGERVTPEYSKTVFELNANSLFDWLTEFGQEFGWERVFSGDEVQEAANDGGAGVIVAQRTELNRPGHIAVVVPEVGAHSVRGSR